MMVRIICACVACALLVCGAAVAQSSNDELFEDVNPPDEIFDGPEENPDDVEEECTREVQINATFPKFFANNSVRATPWNYQNNTFGQPIEITSAGLYTFSGASCDDIERVKFEVVSRVRKKPLPYNLACMGLDFVYGANTFRFGNRDLQALNVSMTGAAMPGEKVMISFGVRGKDDGHLCVNFDECFMEFEASIYLLNAKSFKLSSRRILIGKFSDALGEFSLGNGFQETMKKSLAVTLPKKLKPGTHYLGLSVALPSSDSDPECYANPKFVPGRPADNNHLVSRKRIRVGK